MNTLIISYNQNEEFSGQEGEKGGGREREREGEGREIKGERRQGGRKREKR